MTRIIDVTNSILSNYKDVRKGDIRVAETKEEGSSQLLIDQWKQEIEADLRRLSGGNEATVAAIEQVAAKWGYPLDNLSKENSTMRRPLWYSTYLSQKK